MPLRFVVVTLKHAPSPRRYGSVPRVLYSEPHVLVVDADGGARTSVEQALREEGARVTPAAGAADALRQVTSRRFDAVVVDYALPGLGGIVAVAQMRGLGNGRDLPAIVLGALEGDARETALARTERMSQAVFLDKPATAESLISALHVLLGLS
jgi:CheY-like chemotaxis protein